MPPLSTPTQTPLAPKPTKPPPPHPPLPPPPAAAAAAAAMAEEELPLRRASINSSATAAAPTPSSAPEPPIPRLRGVPERDLHRLPPNPRPSAPGYYYLNGDLTLLANISNPNPHIDVAFRYLSVELYFRDRLIAAQGLAPFAQRRGEARVASLHMVTSEVRASLGFGHLTYWVNGRCDIDLSPPPAGFCWPAAAARSTHSRLFCFFP
uniref:Late embryogenesis abundant protein LEA-2 subgroup domain-containing protein n=1 Tax=Ananas comosus var. bracteatus TaxID=296719 RepID=A0A6V7QX33_ANACO